MRQSSKLNGTAPTHNPDKEIDSNDYHDAIAKMLDQKNSTLIYNYSMNRELSWLNFNRRVLHEALDENVPLFERLKFIAIFQSNLDEFYMVRVGSLTDLSLLKEVARDNKTGMSTKGQLQAIYHETASLFAEKDKIYNQEIVKLAPYGIADMSFQDLSKAMKRRVEEYYKSYIEPILSPQIIDSLHPFPFIENNSLYVVCEFSGEKTKPFGLVSIPKSLDSIYNLKDDIMSYVRVENIVKQFVPQLFVNFKIKNSHIINVIRNADISVEENLADHDHDYRGQMQKILKKRKRLQAVCLNTDSQMSDNLTNFLLKNLNIKRNQVFTTTSPLKMGYVFEIEEQIRQKGYKELFYKPYSPQTNIMLNPKESLINQALEKDMLFIYPYEDINDYIKMLEEAANDPRVLSIKITIYRLSKNSKIVQNLIRAAENDKEVTVIMELQARFDEERNINYSDALFEAGCNIIYGLGRYKVHSKICLITMNINGKIRHITQIGTGNYNEQTSKQYSDLSLITSNETIGEDAADFFKNMNLSNVNGKYNQLLVAPVSFKQTIMSLIDEEIKKGDEGNIFFKFNSLTDRHIISKLSEASQAGVKVRMIIRGISCLRPGVKGFTDNVEIRSIVGRYLEHPRIYKFGKGVDAKIYIGSADLMTRNTERRVEIALPILDNSVKIKVIDYLDMQWKDNIKARKLTNKGIYENIIIRHQEEPFISQDQMMKQSLNRVETQTTDVVETVEKKERERSFFCKLKSFFRI